MDTELFSSYLNPAEQVLWASPAGRGLILDGPDWFMSGFGALFTAVSAGIFYKTPAGLLPFQVSFVLFVGVGAYLMIGRLLLDAWKRQRTYYAVTNRRVLIRQLAPFARFHSLSLDRLPQIELTERSEAGGDIWFGPKPSVEFVLEGEGNAARRPLGFRGIPEAHDVFRLIASTANDIRRAPASSPWR